MKNREASRICHAHREVAVARRGFTVLRVQNSADNKVHLITVRETSSQRVKVAA